MEAGFQPFPYFAQREGGINRLPSPTGSWKPGCCR